MTVRVERAVRLLGVIIVLWLVGLALLLDAWLVGIVIAAPGLVTLALGMRQTLKSDWGAVAAWAACSLAPLSVLCLVALSHVHLYEFTGGGSPYDCVLQDCSANPALGIVHGVALGAFLGAGIMTLRLIALANRGTKPVEADRA
jgi:hypothetical protein